jgi:hypothetical protein
MATTHRCRCAITPAASARTTATKRINVLLFGVKL